MKLLPIVVLGSLGALAGQVPTASIAPRSSAPSSSATEALKHPVGIAAPILGFFAGPGPLDLRTVLRVSSAAQLGPLLPVPDSATKLYLSPHQHYALLEQTADEPLAVWLLNRSHLSAGNETITPIRGTSPHPAVVGFSPHGDSVAVYASTVAKIQVITGLLANPAVARELPAPTPGPVTMLAVSDDGAVVAAETADGQLQQAHDAGAWHFVAGRAVVFTFIPHTHDLIISDSEQKATLRVPLDEPGSAPSVLADGLQPDRLAVTSDGEVLVALESKPSHLWRMSLKAGAMPTLLLDKADTLVSLRDGQTFLLSTSPSVSLLKASTASDSAVVPARPGFALQLPDPSQ